MSECNRVRLTGSFRLPLPPAEAFALFTPTGERTWAEGWNPRFPAAVDDETEPGSVFTTEHSGRHTIWTVVHRDPGRTIQYACVTADDRAGLVTVTCDPASKGATKATVRYDLTALNPEATADLDHFAARYQHFLGHWRASIEHAVAQPKPPPQQRHGPTLA
jgi:hypothetical protein